jgi:exodeoxyribonuclease VII large subunit
MTSYSLFELNEYIKQVMALNFTEPIWVNCEISQVKEVRGQVYMEVVQHSENDNLIKAQSAAVIWYKSFLFIKKKLGDLLPAILTEGTKVLLKVTVEFHERYGLKLNIEDIDISYTIGQMEMARQKIIEKLKQAGVIEKNSYTTLPEVIQKVAIISSATAAGFADFKAQIANNEYGYDIQIDLFPAAMQGGNTEREVCAALDTIALKYSEYDCIAIIRGGGSKLDLASFDNYNIGHKIATFPIPVITGIGHEIDSTVADMVSYSALKTPTAVAAFIIDRNMQFESEMLQAMQWINQMAKQKVEFNKLELEQITQMLVLKPKEITRSHHLQLDQLNALLKQAAKYSLKELAEHISYTEQIIKMADPEKVLKRGFVMLQKNNKTISSIQELVIDDTITLKYYEGSAEAKITKLNK